MLAVEDAGSWAQSHGEWTLTDGCRIDLTLGRTMPLHDIAYHWLRSAQLLIATASGRECHVRSLTVSRKEWLKARDENAPEISGRRPWLQVRARQVQSDYADEPLSGLHLLHRLADLSDEKQVDRFITASRHHRYALERYESAKSGTAGSLETAFTEAAQSVESLDSGLHTDVLEAWQVEAVGIVKQLLEATGHNSKQRRAAVRGIRTAHVKPLSARLRRVDNEARNLVSEATSSTSWAEDIETLRNAVTHGRTGPAFKETTGALIIGREICLLLFELSWLRVMGYDQETADRRFHRRPFLQSNLDRISEHVATLTKVAETLKESRDR